MQQNTTRETNKSNTRRRKSSPTDHLPDVWLRIEIIKDMTGCSINGLKDKVQNLLNLKIEKEVNNEANIPKPKERSNDLQRLDREYNWSNIRNNSFRLNKDEIDLICEALVISPDAFLHTNIRNLVTELYAAGHRNARVEDVLAGVDRAYLIRPELVPDTRLPTARFAEFNPVPWAETNHSLAAEPNFDPGEAVRRELNNILAACTAPYADLNPLDIDQLAVAASSRNYKVAIRHNNPVLLRIYTRLDGDGVYELHKREKYFAEAEFDGKPLFDWAEKLKPLPITDTKCTWIEVPYESREPLNLNNSQHFIACYPFIENGQHLNQATIKELTKEQIDRCLESLAVGLARLHAKAHKYTSTGQGKGEIRPSGFIEGRAMSRFQAFDELLGRNHEFTQQWTSQNPDNRSVIFQSAKDHDDWIEEDSKTKVRPWVMFDLHPFNAFFDLDGAECRLIFDYEALSRSWTEELALATAIHRFSREVIAAEALTGELARDRLNDIIGLMASAYRTGGRTLKDGFEQDIGRLIRVLNIGKLFHCLHFLLRGIDEHDRPSAAHDMEAMKFLRYLHESKFYE